MYFILTNHHLWSVLTTVVFTSFSYNQNNWLISHYTLVSCPLRDKTYTPFVNDYLLLLQDSTILTVVDSLTLIYIVYIIPYQSCTLEKQNKKWYLVWLCRLFNRLLVSPWTPVKSSTYMEQTRQISSPETDTFGINVRNDVSPFLQICVFLTWTISFD